MPVTRIKQQGAVLVAVLVAVIVLMAFGLTMMTAVTMTADELGSTRAHLKRLYLAENAIQEARIDLNSGGSGTVGSPANPIAFGGGSFFITSVDNGDGTFTGTAVGTYQRGQRTIRTVFEREKGVFHHAIYAGNQSNDPTYTLDFGGLGVEADQINGDIYSGGSIDRQGDAALNGGVAARDALQNTTGETGVIREAPDLNAMNYEANHDVNVANEFATAGYYASDDAGGDAWQLPETNEAHLFRKNPTDRATENGSTVKDDYYLEDPYEPVNVDPTQTGASAYEISLTDGNGRLFFIDGNLWIHNKPTYSFIFNAPGGVRATFVVRGNIYISDNLFYTNPATDGVAFIAMKDPVVPDSGNIYFGDPRGGTLVNMNGFLYAENNFFDTNLDAAGSAVVNLNGTMSAGEKVSIERTGPNHHTSLRVNFDPRLKHEALALPGIPTVTGGHLFRVVAWMEVSTP